MFCLDDKDKQIEVAVKLFNGRECTHKSLVCELMASLLARDLDLLVPQPFLVNIDEELNSGIYDFGHKQRFLNSIGVNFGSKFLSQGYTTWLQKRTIPGSMMQNAAEIFAFDIIIQNPDRRKDKPNLLCKGDELFIIDHEMAFSFLYSIIPDEYPWDGKGMNFVKDHVFYDELKGNKLSLDRLQGAFVAIDNSRFDMYVDLIPDDWRKECGDAVEQICEYLMMARDNSKGLFQRIKEVLV